MAVVVGVDGAGRTHRLDQMAAESTRTDILRIKPPIDDLPDIDSGMVVFVDDVHRLAETHLEALTTAVRRGVAMVVARRPTIHSPGLADLDEAIAAQGEVELLSPLDATGVADLCEAVTGTRPSPEVATRVDLASGGLPAVVAAIAAAPDGVPPPTLIARVQRRLARLDPPVAALARLLALGLALPDRVLHAASGLDEARFATAMRTLHDEGMLVPRGEVMIPAVAEALLADLPPAERRRTHEAAARALIEAGSDVVATATQLRAARAFIPAAATVYAAAGDRTRFTDPGAAITWYGDAIEAGADPATLAAGRAEAAALLGLPVDADEVVDHDSARRMTLVEGTVAAQHGWAERSAATLLAVAEPGPLLAVPALVMTGQLEEARHAAGGAGAAPLRLLAEAALTAAADPVAAIPLFIEVAEATERNPPAVVLPDTPHALGALVASLAGDAASAEHLLNRALSANTGGPVMVDRHRLLLAWVRIRAGRYDTAVAETTRVAPAGLAGRERSLLAALQAAIARRSGDVARLRDAWADMDPVLARRTVDVSAVEAIEELAVAAARLRRHQRIAPVLDTLDSIVDRLGATWKVAVGWLRLQIAIAEEDTQASASAARYLAGVSSDRVLGRRQRAQCAAASLWSRALAGEVDPDSTIAVGEELAAVELPWEGSRLVGHAAIRTADASAARRLLERARDLSSAEVVPADGLAESRHGGLSAREVDVARMVLAGDTYREIGARLFISPKTVEHHVARIRTKLGATTRAEFLATLRTVLGGSEQRG